MSKRAFTYDELTGGDSSVGVIELWKSGGLDDATCERMAHIGRFIERVWAEGSSLICEDDLQQYWRETADVELPTEPLAMMDLLPWLAEFIGLES